MASNPFDSAAAKTSSLASFGAWANCLINQILDRLEHRRQLRQLDSLSDAMLADIGVSRCDVERARRSPFRGRTTAS